MFCSKLRTRPIWKALGPVVASSSPWKLQGLVKSAFWTILTATESNLETHDLALPLSAGSKDSHLPILILTSANLNEEDLPDTKTRIQLFVTAIEGGGSVITLILKDDHDPQTCLNGLESYMRLQAVFVSTISSTGTTTYYPSSLFEGDASCPALPISDISSLFTTIKEYLNGLRIAPEISHRPPIVTNLIAQATASAPAKPLSEHNANVVSDIFSSFQEFEEATRTKQGQAKLRDYLDSTTAEEIVDFWADEWIV
jgi:hypothetical protein